MSHGSQLRRWWMRNNPSPRQKICLFLVALLLVVCYYSSHVPRPIQVKSIVVIGKDDMNGVRRNRRQFSDVTGCKLATMDTYGAEMMPFIEAVKPMNCEQRAGEKDWVRVDEEGRLVKTLERIDAECEIEYFRRKTDHENENIGKEKVRDQKMTSDFGIVRCTQGGQSWQLPVMSAVRNESLVRELKGKSAGSGTKALDVVIFGFDSMSQQHFRRKMPKTIQQLASMGAITLNGYNIVGDGTPQAFIPILTGKSELELPNTRKRYRDANFVDVYPFIWKKFAEAGYVTLFGEDDFNIGMFSYRLKGFDKQPTSHYTRNFYKEVEALPGSRKDQGQCLGSAPAFSSWFQYSRHFLREYHDVPKFLLMHQGAYSHDSINLIEAEDEYFAGHLKDLQRDGMLDNAVVIVMADHGHRFMQIRNTHQGQLEERLPMFSVVLPKKLRETERGKNMYRNLKANRDVLTSPFDIHRTLLDILNPPEDVSTLQSVSQRSLSLLRPILKSRSCEQAGVEAHWCTCLNWQNATSNWQDVRQTQVLAQGLATAIDRQLSEVRHLCSNVTLKGVISASKLAPNDNLLRYNNVKDKDGFEPEFKGETRALFAHYQLKIVTSPNDAVYEATVYFDGRKGELEVDLQSLSHVNAYGEDPHCVVKTHNTLVLYCVCHDRVR